MTPQELARLLYNELDRDGWGDIDPYLLLLVADGDYKDSDHEQDAAALEKVLARVAKRIKSRE